MTKARDIASAAPAPSTVSATELGFCNNAEASEIVKSDWKKQFPYWEKDLEFDPESSFCYVYTKRRDVARAFRWWAYNKYIKHHLEDFKV